MKWDKKIKENIKEASLTTRYDCLDDDGELDTDEWILKTRELLQEDYIEDEHDFMAEACFVYIHQEQSLMRRQSRQRIYSYMPSESDTTESSIGFPPIEANGAQEEHEEVAKEGSEPKLPTYDSLKGEIVSVPQAGFRPIQKLVLKCTLREMEIVADDFGKRSASLYQRELRYSHIAKLMRNAGLDEDDQVEDLYG